MSHKYRESKNNVIYLNKDKSNKINRNKSNQINRSKSNQEKVNMKKSLRKGKINIKNMSILILGILILSFAAVKFVNGISTLVKSVSEKVVKTTQAETVKLEKQFDIDEEEDISIKKYTIFVDPGHGGDDNGMQSKDTGKYEKEITLEIGKKLVSKLSKYNDIDVIISRSDNTKNITTDERLEEATKSKADMIVSLQLNYESGGNTATGVEIYYKYDEINEVRDLARMIQKSINSYVEVRDRGVGIGDFTLLNKATVPSVIVNCGFITNPNDVKNLTDESYLDEFTEGIAQGILSYIDANK